MRKYVFRTAPGSADLPRRRSCCALPIGRICSSHDQCWGVVLDSAAVRWAAAEGVPEVVITPICLLHERSIDEML